MELWANGFRCAVSHISNFGNNRYSTRGEIAEATTTGLGIQAETANAVVIDNLVVKEAVASDTSYFATSGETNAGNVQFLPLSTRNLDSDNFRSHMQGLQYGFRPLVKLYCCWVLTITATTLPTLWI